MPTIKSKTIYEAFDGEEFSNEKEAKEYERWVRKNGIELRDEFFNKREFTDYLGHIDTKLLDFIKSYSDEDAWKIMKSLNCANLQIQDRICISDNNEWLDPSN